MTTENTYRTDYAGIDYSHFKTTNRNPKTGIRYGVISLSSVSGWIWDEMTPVYHFTCENCDTDLGEPGEHSNCPGCDMPLEPEGWEHVSEGLKFHMTQGSNEIWVTESPVVTRAQYCSPCAPGAGNLNAPCFDGAWTYALPEEFFDKPREELMDLVDDYARPCPYLDDLHPVYVDYCHSKTGPFIRGKEVPDTNTYIYEKHLMRRYCTGKWVAVTVEEGVKGRDNYSHATRSSGIYDHYAGVAKYKQMQMGDGLFGIWVEYKPVGIDDEEGRLKHLRG